MAGYPGGYGGYPGQTPGYGAPSGPGQYGGQYPQQQGYPPQQPSYPPGGYGGPPSAAYGAPPGADPTLWNWFIAVDRDRSGAISSDELEQALMNNNWSRFNQETCRLMIGFGESIGLRIGAFIGMFTTLDKYSDGRTMKKFKSV